MLAFTAKYDGLAVDSVAELALSTDYLKAAIDSLDVDLRRSLELAATRIQAFHEKQRPEGFSYTDEAGVNLAMRHTPVDAVGLYVPGGKAFIHLRY